MSGRSSSCSVVQEENLVRRMRKTPGTPIKTGYQLTPRKTGSKRCLFQVTSPTGSDDLGPVSPVSAASCSSLNSFGSPHFSPNGTFSTPPRTPKNDKTPTRRSSVLNAKKIEVKSSLFPNLKLSTSKSRRTPRTPTTLLSKMLTPQSKIDSVEDIEEGIRSLSTPSTTRSMRRRRQIFSDNFVAESPTIAGSEESEEECSVEEGHAPTKLKIEPLTCESFYGPAPQVPKAKSTLVIDSLQPRRALIRAQSKESLSSNRSFVKGGNRQRTLSNGRRRYRSRSSPRNRLKTPHVGVWHNIKKPIKIKKLVKVEKPLISPQSRVGKMLNSPNKKEIKIKSKPLFQGNPRKRIAHSQKRSRKEMEDDSIIDPFPNSLIKRKKLPFSQNTTHPAIEEKVQPLENPDPNKKFLKYGKARKATFTLTENVKFRIADGVMTLQTPKKRRKLYSGKKDIIEDFDDFDDGDKEIDQSVQGILNWLRCEKETTGESKAQAAKHSASQVLRDLEGKNRTPSKTATNIQRSPLKTVSNLPTLITNDFETDDENSPLKQAQEKSVNEVSLAKTGTMVSYLTNILVNKDQEVDLNSPTAEGEIENALPNETGKLYSVFYKRNWNKVPANNDNGNSKANTNRKRILVPDNQYLLDAGQSSIGIVTCNKCGVMYQAGDFADEATHNNFHNHLPELRFNGWVNERVVGKYPNGKVIMILSCDPKIWWQKVSKIVDIVDQELGFPEASLKSLYHKTVYLYINEKSKQIAGCLIAEECKVAYRMFPPLEGVDVDSCSKDPTPCKVGISRIWTALSHRRKGVASRMIDCLQRTFLFGDIVHIDQIAFSVPSPAGKLLAQKVTGRLDFLVYGFA